MLKADRVRIREYLKGRFGHEPVTVIFQHSYMCVLFYRLAHYFFSHGFGKFSRVFTQLNSLVNHFDITPFSVVGGGMLIVHPPTSTFSGQVGENLTLFARSGIGMMPRSADVGSGAGLPVLGDDVLLEPGCGVMGPVTIGDHCRISSKTGVVMSMPAGTRSRPSRGMDNCVTPATDKGVNSDSEANEAEFNCRHRSLKKSWREFSRDIRRYCGEKYGKNQTDHSFGRKISAALSHEIMCNFLYRFSHYLYARGLRRSAVIFSKLNSLLNQSEIHPQTCVSGGLYIPHPAGAVLRCIAGENLTLYARTVCMIDSPGTPLPVVGSNVSLAGLSGVYGPARLGDNVALGNDAQVYGDVADDSLVVRRHQRIVAEPIADASPKNGFAPAGVPVFDGQTRQSHRELKQLLAQDRAGLSRVSESGLAGNIYPGYLCVWLYRHSGYFWAKGHRRVARWLWRINGQITGADIDPRCRIGGGLAVPNPSGVSLAVHGGDNLVIGALAGISGQNDFCHGGSACFPELGNNVTLGVLAMIRGKLTIGDRVSIANGCLVLDDVGSDMEVSKLPPRAFRRRSRSAPRVN